MTVPNRRQPNVKPGLQDQTSIALNLFKTILRTEINRTELEWSWAVIERDITIQEQREERQRQLRNQLWSILLCFIVLKVLSLLGCLDGVFYSLKTQTLEQHLFGAVAGERRNELIPWEITTLTISVLDSEQDQKTL
jgi:hypothetical protein